MFKKITVFSIFILLLGGCSSSELDDRYVGTTDHYYRELNSNKFESKNYYSLNSSSCIKKGEQFDIRLDGQVLSQSFDGIKENASEGSFFGFNDASHDTNEIGIFLTVQELNRETDSTKFMLSEAEVKKNTIDSRLIYTSYSRKPGQPLNQKNKLVYSSEYSGNDLRFMIEVREFDQENGEGMMEVINILSEEASRYTQAANPIIGSLLDKMGSAAKNGIFKDDVVAAFDMEFVPCGIYKNNDQVYLSEGQVLFLRHSQNEEFKRQNDLTWDNNNNVLNGGEGRSYTSFYIYRRENI